MLWDNYRRRKGKSKDGPKIKLKGKINIAMTQIALARTKRPGQPMLGHRLAGVQAHSLPIQTRDSGPPESRSTDPCLRGRSNSPMALPTRSAHNHTTDWPASRAPIGRPWGCNKILHIRNFAKITYHLGHSREFLRSQWNHTNVERRSVDYQVVYSDKIKKVRKVKEEMEMLKYDGFTWFTYLFVCF